MAANQNSKSNNPFDFLNNLGDLGDIRKFLGPDFFKNLPMPNINGGSFFSDSDGSDASSFPRVDLYGRGSQEMIAVMELPGLTSSKDVQVAVRGNILSVRGHITARFHHRGDSVILSECHHGAFEREIELPGRVLTDGVRAVYRSGLLVVYLTRDTADDVVDNRVAIDFEGQ
ncbi:hypothetical protein GCM10025857_11990 [Alicyclobacillus contaminans]|uniref:Hsp20/alpha crystallin family protein n=1 Tax=Alicyclobacillus contaminans TaxID=392016 RepID=UPI0004244D53|nr:Hsp20/alpha crystallin family protein [Alicyclobacillus contaminans]GMA49842.1 hypothetical protein GCM10025857_11990 [Alicyclobacillus contaminans]